MAIKVAMIGAGSIGFTRKLVRDILTVPELRDTEAPLAAANEILRELVARLEKQKFDPQAADSQSNDAVKNYVLSQAYEVLGDIEKSNALLGKALDADPDAALLAGIESSEAPQKQDE